MKVSFDRVVVYHEMPSHFPFSLFVESVRRLIVSHGSHDEDVFRRTAESLARELSVTNRPSEAKALRDALGALALNGKPQTLKPAPPQMTNRSGEPLIAFKEPRISFDRLFLSGETDDSLKRATLEHANALSLAEAGLAPKSKFLFWGPPGCGKSVTAEALAFELGWSFGVVRLSSLISSFVGETASNLQKVFTYANNHQMVILFDEADAVAKNREDRNDVGELKRVVNSLLQCLDQLEPRKSIAILASNHQHLFDSAIWRRFDDVVEFPLPDREQRLAHLKFLSNGLPLKGHLLQVATQAEGASFADIERAVREVAKSFVLSRAAEVKASEVATEINRWRRKQKAANFSRKSK